MSLDSIESVTLPVEFTEFDDLVDVRSPSEFAEDHLPGAINLPVLDDSQREEVGTLYRRAPFEARRLGAGFTSTAIGRHLGGTLASRPKDWKPLLYCWRGGMRSRSFALVLRSVGWRARVLEGGYKAWRRFVIEDLERRLADPGCRFHVIAGLTGSGKTRLLEHLAQAGGQVLDLEGLANHRGSLLGSQGPQPTQKRFETLLHQQLCTLAPEQPIFVEAESSRIGSVYVPAPLWRQLSESRVTELVLPRPARVQLLLEDYSHFPAEPTHLRDLLDELRKLRGHEQVDSWQRQVSTGDWPEFVDSILEHHYDLVYRRPGAPDSVYRKPDRHLELPDGARASFDRAASDLLGSAERLVTP